MSICGSDYLRLTVKIIGIILIIIILVSGIKEYIAASKSKNKETLKEVQKSFNKRVAVVIYIICIPLIIMIISKILRKPNIYNCVFGYPEENVSIKVGE